MENRPPIFRAEAVEHRAQARTRADLVRIAPRWTTWAFYGLVGLFLLGIVAASLLRMETMVVGSAQVDSHGHVVVLLPASVRGVRTGNRVEVAGSEGSVTSVEKVTSTASLVQTDIAIPSYFAEGEEARVVTGSQPAILALVPGLSAIFGADG